MVKERVILGIDPGTIVMGYGVLLVLNNKPYLQTMGVLQLNKYFGKNVQSMLKLGRAQGVAMAAAMERDVPIFEYAPLKIKQAITGNGNASKEQVAGVLKSYLRIKEENMLPQLDATDGLAAAVCHFFQSSSPVLEKKYTNWGDFIKKNPDKIHKK